MPIAVNLVDTPGNKVYSMGMTNTGTRRVITSQGWIITQVRQADGTWWNIDVKRVTG